MSKTVSTAMKAHLALPLTTLTFCWRITRKDGVEFFFTTFDQDLVVDGNTYLAASGYNPTAVQSNSDYSVSNLEIAGFFDNDAIEETDLAAGKFDNAKVKIFVLNWADLSMGVIAIIRGKFGQAAMSKQGFFTIEMRSLMQQLQQVIGSFYTQVCQHDLGDAKCKVPIAPADIARSTAYVIGDVVHVADTLPAPDSSAYHDRLFTCTTAGTTDSTAPSYDYTVGNSTTDGTAVFIASESWTRAGSVVSGTQTTAGNRKVFNIAVTDARAGDGWFTFGALTWETGLNAGITTEIRDWVVSSDALTLRFGLPYVPAIGDKFRLYPGCNLFASGCKKFSNIINRLGFDFIPGQIAITGYGTGNGSV